MKQYQITISEKDIYSSITVLEIIYQDVKKQNETMGDLCISETIKDILQKLKQAKQKPYTNFQKVKDEMTIEDVVRMMFVFTDKDICSSCKHFNFECYKPENRDKCRRKWLESE